MRSNNRAQDGAEMSCIISVDQIGADGLSLTLSATSAERRALANLFGLISLDLFEAAVQLKPASEGLGVNMIANVVADVVQACVVTLDPVQDRVEASVEVLFLPIEEIPEVELEPGADLDEEDLADPAEPIVNNNIDVGGILAEHLALQLNPYPRKPGVSLKDRAGDLKGIATIGEDESEADEVKENPFAVLKRLTRTDQANT